MFSKHGDITWSSKPPPRTSLRGPQSIAASERVPRGGPTAAAREASRDVLSTFLAYFTPELEDIVIEMTNLEGPVDRTELRAYVGLLILAGVYRSRGEACESLWDAESGRAVFRATMPLKTFRSYSSVLRFDDRETREARRAALSSSSSSSSSYGDKLAPVRKLWDAWCQRLPLLYDPGPEVTVDERLVAFKGRCPFRQYMPSKPAKYGIKLWAVCDARSSYAWKMQVYTGKPRQGAPAEKNLATRVALDLTEGLGPGRTVTCDNFFTSFELARRLFFERGLTLLGTLRANRTEVPRELACPPTTRGNGRRVGSFSFAFATGEGGGPSVALISYLAKKTRNVLILTTAPHDEQEQQQQQHKPAAVLHYNRTKGGVDNLDKVTGTYSCRRKTCRWPMVIFHNMIDVSAYNAFVLWRELNPTWMPGKRNRRRLFLEQLGRALVGPSVIRRIKGKC
ncbi:piggyBac transposable element-derived protein 4-like [Periophthalmus magnuspinnatus]|uniref:piggyBac transposable element-derived protein 4-like n=1 Tax=Periophthalmus magnuspinnatus TaxID=409849 RepID=UPI0024365C9B|nr:piggyBac transposable element-derived protein 4-like [Periophthalmus magnuspinnatus]